MSSATTLRERNVQELDVEFEDLEDPSLPLRRAVVLILISLIAPGSAQIFTGRRHLGRIVLRGWLLLLGLLALIWLVWMLNRNVVLWFATSALVLHVLAAVCFLVALVWPLVVIDAWRLGRPASLPRRSRQLMTVLLVVSVLVATVPAAATGRRLLAGAGLLDSVFGIGTASAATSGRYNVLLLGGDAGPDRIGTRPDSMTLASIDAKTGRTVLFSLPRNLENVRFPEGTPADKALPEGWTCGDNCLLNGLYTWGAEHPAAFPQAPDPGAAAMKSAAEWITGLKVNYYVLIDLKGFRQLIDAMGGVTITVGERVPIGGGSSKVSGYIEPGTQRLDGYHALWFARSRHGANDYARMQRQKCVMNAMVTQLDPATLLAKFQGLAAAAGEVMSTDLPASELSTFIDLGSKAKAQKLTSVAFVPPLINPAYPDFDVVRQRVIAALEASRAKPSAAVSDRPRSSQPVSAGGGSGGVGTDRSSSGSGASGSGRTTSPGSAQDVAEACTPG